jgi:hypothetical protein
MRTTGMTRRIRARAAKLAAVILAATAVAAITAVGASAAVIYNNTPAREKNYPSLGFQATQTSEVGGQVEFLAGGGRTSSTVTTLMSSWACESLTGGTSCKTTHGGHFEWPITLNVYKVNGVNEPEGAPIASVTQEVAVPYRPSANSKCPETSEGVVGYAYPSCFSGKAFKVKFTLNRLLKLPEKAIISVAYDTTGYGNASCGANLNCINKTEVGEDSLNVVLIENAVASPGSMPLQSTEGPDLGDIYGNSEHAGFYEPLPTPSPIKFALAGAWTLQPVFKVTATPH